MSCPAQPGKRRCPVAAPERAVTALNPDRLPVREERVEGHLVGWEQQEVRAAADMVGDHLVVLAGDDEGRLLERPRLAVPESREPFTQVALRGPDELACLRGAPAPRVNREIDMVLRHEAPVRRPDLES